MLVTFWGVRGSYPIARRDNIRYGGNSTCVQIQAMGEDPLIMDGGSGIRVLGSSLLDGPFGKGQGFANILVGHALGPHPRLSLLRSALLRRQPLPVLFGGAVRGRAAAHPRGAARGPALPRALR